MQSRHPQDYEKYGADIADILNCPDYVGKNPKDDSIEYVKEYQVDGEFVKVAVLHFTWWNVFCTFFIYPK